MNKVQTLYFTTCFLTSKWRGGGGGGGGGEAVHTCSHHLVSTPKLVHFPVDVILTRRQIERLHPLVSILSALRSYFGDFHLSAKVHLEPLRMIVVSCAPGPNIATAFNLTQSPQSSGVKLIEFR